MTQEGTQQQLQQLTLAEKINLATEQSGKIATLFAPHAADAIKAGVAAEPVILSLVDIFKNLFVHHTKGHK